MNPARLRLADQSLPRAGRSDRVEHPQSACNFQLRFHRGGPVISNIVKYLLIYGLIAAAIALTGTALFTGTPILELIGLRSPATSGAGESSGGAWIFWGILLGFVLLPGALSTLFDSKGQSAAGWLMLIGIGLSILLAVIWFFGWLLWSLLRLIF